MGGMELGPLLRRAAVDAPAGTSLVEVGCWLGAGTAQLALGIRDRSGGPVDLHCYDRWEANASEVAKAARWGVELSAGMDTLPHTRRALEPFDVAVEFHKGDIMAVQWNRGPISVYVDDAAKKWQAFYHVLFTFGPHWIPGETVVVLMDYNLWQSTDDARHRCQKEFIESNHDCFAPIDYVGRASTLGGQPTQPAVFRYTQPLDFKRWVAASCWARLDAAEREIKGLVDDVRRRDEKLSQLKNSTSWRVTKPLRCCSDTLRSRGRASPE